MINPPPPTVDQRKRAILENITRLAQCGGVISYIGAEQPLTLADLIAWESYFYGEPTALS